MTVIPKRTRAAKIILYVIAAVLLCGVLLTAVFPMTEITGGASNTDTSTDRFAATLSDGRVYTLIFRSPEKCLLGMNFFFRVDGDPGSGFLDYSVQYQDGSIEEHSRPLSELLIISKSKKEATQFDFGREVTEGETVTIRFHLRDTAEDTHVYLLGNLNTAEEYQYFRGDLERPMLPYFQNVIKSRTYTITIELAVLFLIAAAGILILRHRYSGENPDEEDTQDYR